MENAERCSLTKNAICTAQFKEYFESIYITDDEFKADNEVKLLLDKYVRDELSVKMKSVHVSMQITITCVGTISAPVSAAVMGRDKRIHCNIKQYWRHGVMLHTPQDLNVPRITTLTHYKQSHGVAVQGPYYSNHVLTLNCVLPKAVGTSFGLGGGGKKIFTRLRRANFFGYHTYISKGYTLYKIFQISTGI